MKVTSQLNVYQFKNAIHVGYMNSHQPFNGSQSVVGMHKSGIKTNFQNSPTGLRSSKIRTNNRQKIQNLGITADDEGNILIAEWKNSKITGKYFLFKPFGNNEGSISKNAGISQFGEVRNNVLEGENYLLDISGNIAKSDFSNDKINKKCLIYHKYKLKNQRTVQCKLLTFQSNDASQGLKYKENKKLIPPIKNLSKISNNTKGLPTVGVETNQLTNLTQFLQNFVSAYEVETNLDEQKMQFRKFNITQSEYFFGFSKRITIKHSQKDQKNIDSASNFNGFGIVFRNEWPYKYGFFEKGKLNGLGRYYQSQLQVFDGFFENDQLVEGFIFDYYQNNTYFGQKIDKNFQIIENIKGISTNYSQQYKKTQHLKSLDFINNYFNFPSIISKSPWPYRVNQALQEQNSIKHVINEFRNELDISEIQRKGQNTQDKVQQMLIRQMSSSQPSRIITARSINEVKSIAIKNTINMYLRRLSPSSAQKQTADQLELQRNIQEYQDLRRIKQSKTARKKSGRKSNQQTPRTTNRNKVSTYGKQQLTQRSTHRHEGSDCTQSQKTQDFRQLINSYKEYQNKQNSVAGRQRHLQSLNQNNRIQSKSDMIKEDHKLFVNNLKKTPQKCQHKSKRSALQLDQIYRLHFKRAKK